MVEKRTESKRPEAIDPALDGDHRYRDLLERIPAVTYIAEPGQSCYWTYVSPQIESMLGFSPDEWQADPERWFRQIHPEDRERALGDENRSGATGEPLCSEYRLIARDGRVVWVRDEAVLVGDLDSGSSYWQGFMFDITDRKRTEQALEDSERRYHSLFDDVPVALYRTDPEGKLLDANSALAALLRFPDRESLLRMDALDLYVDKEDRLGWEMLIERELVVRDFELKLRTKEGAVIWVRDSARAVCDDDGKILYYEGTLQDITERKRAEAELQAANEKLASWVAELERRNEEMELIREMSDLLQGCQNPEEAYEVIGHSAERLFKDESGALYLITASRNAVDPTAVWGDPSLGEQVFSPEDCWALRSGRLHHVDGHQSRLVCRHLRGAAVSDSLCVPMMAQGEAVGVLHVQAGKDERGQESVRSAGSREQLAVAVAEHLALALANLKLRETLRTQSIRDPLTGLFNRRYMEESFEREIMRASRSGAPVAVIMMDLDQFTRYNNTFGHQAGDALLSALGELLRSRTRGGDIVCRYGGEEFTLIMPEVTLEVALDRAEQIRSELKQMSVYLKGETLGTATASFGVAVYPENGTTAESLLRAADMALYAAKNAGRDRVHADGALTPLAERA